MNRKLKLISLRIVSGSLGVLMLFLLLAGVVTSCTTSSQIPLSIREKEERSEELDDEDFQATERGDIPVVDKDELRRLEEERRKEIEEMEADFFERTNYALSQYVKAQSSFYAGQFTQALRQVRLGLEQKETADLYALKGSIYHAQDQTARAADNWRKAVDMDSSVVGEIYPGMQEWYAGRQNDSGSAN